MIAVTEGGAVDIILQEMGPEQCCPSLEHPKILWLGYEKNIRKMSIDRNIQAPLLSADENIVWLICQTRHHHCSVCFLLQQCILMTYKVMCK